MEGTVIGTYRVIRKLGEGGMGAVYAGEHSLLGRRAAIKVLLPALSQNQEIVQRFFNEARAATAIQDPGIVQIFDFGYHTDGSAYIVMEFLEGEALDARLKRFGRLAVPDALRIMRQVASSLAAAHARGIIHRDLKPENIYIVADREVAGGERPKILDFGIAKLTGDTESKVKTHTAAIMGTPMYMSPEQCRGAGQIDHRSDIYALGCVLFHLLTGRPPFDGEGVGEIIACHLREPAPWASQLVPGIPPEVDTLIQRCMAKTPDQRFQSAGELADAIGWMLGQGGQPVAAALPSGSFATPGQPTTLSGAASVRMTGPGAGVPALGTGVPAPAGRGKLGFVVGAIGAAAIAVAIIIAVSAGGSSHSSSSTSAAPAGNGAPTGGAAASDLAGEKSAPAKAADPAAAKTPAAPTDAEQAATAKAESEKAAAQLADKVAAEKQDLDKAAAEQAAAIDALTKAKDESERDKARAALAAAEKKRRHKTGTGDAGKTGDTATKTGGTDGKTGGDQGSAKPTGSGVPGDLDGDGIPDVR